MVLLYRYIDWDKFSEYSITQQGDISGNIGCSDYLDRNVFTSDKQRVTDVLPNWLRGQVKLENLLTLVKFSYIVSYFIQPINTLKNHKDEK